MGNWAVMICCGLALCGGMQCAFAPPADDNNDQGAIYNNTTDPTNQRAAYIGSDACRACHPDIAAQHDVHGHAYQLNRIEDGPPTYPAEGTRAGVPNPPEGFDWTDISYVVGGYTRRALFIDRDGFLLTTGVLGIPTQWNLSFPAIGSMPGFVPYETADTSPKPYGFSCFVCHTTEPRPPDEDFPRFEENRPGFLGTWAEAGVQCEACHGPGSNHIPNPSARDIFVGVDASNCGVCHTRGNDAGVIPARDGFILNYEQWPELLASGGHTGFDCTICHDPHVSANYDRGNAIRNDCRVCHTNVNMALHEGKTFIRGDYREPLSCESCHMPFATRSAANAGADVVGQLGRMGDTRTHIFRINPSPSNFQAMFREDGSTVAKDQFQRAAVTLDFVCFRCHNGIGNAREISTLAGASGVATGMHSIVVP